ncbi:FxsA family membrane protein [Streptomyces sp. ISL-11]|uniref:FxsA family membrane protein n=1 Tax=Streptomyces sp. ISL-11 TaxID=2819174 RepID=UPI001BE59446|nr:FxsA family membrane protein [Streptomyces sp. ISL-11]MBT2382206.1 FxsA family protein [Streptomyces sp. ISL-11]
MTFGAPQQTVDGRPAKRGRARRLIPLGVAVWAVLEIWLLTLVADAAGGLTVLALLAGGVLVGSYVIKRAGRRAWQRLAGSLQPGAATAGTAPEGGGNGLTMLGGLLIILPGLLSDAAGLLCLFPPTRALLRKGLERRLGRAAAPGTLGDAFQQARMRMPDGKVVQGEVVPDDEPPAPRHDDPQLPR